MEALQACHQILYQHLNGQGAWDMRLYPVESAPPSAEYPYLTWFWSGGGNELQATGSQIARLQMSVKGVAGDQDGISDPMGLALGMQSEISEALRNAGVQDVGGMSLPSHARWMVLTVTQGRMIWMRVQLDDKRWSYHAGHVYEILLERV